MIWNNWQYETSATIVPQKRFQGTAEYVRKKKSYILRVTDTKTKKVVVKESMTARDTDVAIAKARLLAKKYEENYGYRRTRTNTDL